MLSRLTLICLLLILCTTHPCIAGVDETYVRASDGGWGTDILNRLIGRKTFRRSYALVVGIGAYTDYKTLSAPAKDAERFRDFLRDEAHFDEIITLTDEKATRARIEELMDRKLPQTVQNNDRFLFYFSGHGVTRQLSGSKRGYLVLQSSRKNAWNEMIDMPRVSDWTENFRHARHALFLIDACFSGLAARERKGDSDIRDETIQRLMQPASYIVTAGVEGEQSFIVDQESIFTKAFLAAARGRMSVPPDGVVSLSEIMVQINRFIDGERARLRDQIRMTPRAYYARTEDNAGEFFFLPAIEKPAASPDATDHPPAPPTPSVQGKGETKLATAQSYVARGLAYADDDDLDRALADYDEAIRLDSKYAAAFNNRGDVYWKKEDFKQAVADYSRAIELDPTNVSFLLNRAHAYYMGDPSDDFSGYDDDALADYNKAISLDPKSAEAFNGRGLVFESDRKYDDALADYNEAIRLDPAYADAFRNRGDVYTRKGNLEAAIQDYSKAIQLNPSDASFLVARGNAYYDKKDYDKSLADYNSATRIDADYHIRFHADAYHYRADIRKAKGNIDGAIDDYSQAMRFESDSQTKSLWLIDRGDAYYATKDYTHALADYNESIRLNAADSQRPSLGYPRAYSGRGDIRNMNGDINGAIDDYSLAIRGTASKEPYLIKRGNAYYAKKDYDNALADYNETLRLDPNNAAALYNRGLVEQRQGDMSGANGDIARAKQLSPGIDRPASPR
jgi:tetratricopeptide (TPR) repeat protein